MIQFGVEFKQSTEELSCKFSNIHRNRARIKKALDHALRGSKFCNLNNCFYLICTIYNENKYPVSIMLANQIRLLEVLIVEATTKTSMLAC